MIIYYNIMFLVRLQSAFVFWNRLPKYQHPGKVEITLDNAVLPQNTCEFLQCLVRSGYEGDLILNLKGSFDQMEPCDEILLILKDSRYSMWLLNCALIQRKLFNPITLKTFLLLLDKLVGFYMKDRVR